LTAAPGPETIDLRLTPQLPGQAAQGPIGGLGVHIMRTMMDDIGYRRTNGQNLLTLRKRFAWIDPDTVA
jgi:anti-sigma regulatory factor (Ser/Thr protein kinase)